MHFAYKGILQCLAARTRARRRSDVKGLTLVALDGLFLATFGRTTSGKQSCPYRGGTVRRRIVRELWEARGWALDKLIDLIDPGAIRTYACRRRGRWLVFEDLSRRSLKR
jgi:hypothetical protein